MNLYDDKTYFTTKEKLKETIDKYGVAIIPNVFDEKECDDLLSKMWDFFEHITQKWNEPIKRNDKQTWKQFYNLYPLHSMLVQHFSIGHAQFAWNARQNPKAIEIFKHFWGCDDLLVSFDGSSFHLPPEVTGKGWNLKKPTYHTDQSYTRNSFECIQSFVTLLDINDGDATLSFMEKSNNHHFMFAKEFDVKNESDWYQLDETEEQFYVERQCKYKKIKCPKGSMVFWDSRTIHCGVQPLKERKKENIRAVIYLCYAPKSSITESNLNKKIQAFKIMRTTNHWPCNPKLFSINPITHGKTPPIITPIDRPILTNTGRKLVGLESVENLENEQTN